LFIEIRQIKIKQSRVEVDAHVARRGLLLVYDCKVFGDTSINVDEVISPRFLFVSTSAFRTEPNINITNNFKTKNEMTKTFRFIGMALMAVLVGASLAACSSDDDSSGSGTNVSSSAQKFIGYWTTNGGGNSEYLEYMAFFPDGTCSAGAHSNWHTSGGGLSSAWSFDDQNNVLTSTMTLHSYINGYPLQFNTVIWLDDKNFTCVMTGYDYAVTAKLGTKGEYTKAVIESFKWVSEKDGTALPSNGWWSTNSDTAYVSTFSVSTSLGSSGQKPIGVVELHNPTNKDFYLTYKKNDAKTADKYMRAKE